MQRAKIKVVVQYAGEFITKDAGSKVKFKRKSIESSDKIEKRKEFPKNRLLEFRLKFNDSGR